MDPRFAGKAANRHRVVRGRRRVMQDQSAASWRAVRHPRSSAPASDAATPPIGGARPTGTRQAGISTFAGNAMTLPPGTIVRSGEHTSELQSLMRISYAVFCLKKKTQTTTIHT